MADAVEVAIESALLNRLVALTLSPVVPVSLPNLGFVPPVPGPNVCWLRGTYLPASSTELSIGFQSSNQHYGIFQVDVFYGQGSGDLAPGRIASSVLQWFKRGTILTKDGFSVKIAKLPSRGAAAEASPWIMIPISIPYLCFAVNP